MDAATTAGEQYVDQFELYRKFMELDDTVAFLTILNYSNMTLTGNNNYIEWGQIEEMSELIHHGEKEAITIRADKPAKGIEGLISYKLPDGYRFYVFLKVVKNRSASHHLGICLAPTSKKLDGPLDRKWYRKMKSGKYCLVINTNHKKNPRTMQCCHGPYCVQVSMTTDYQPDVPVRIIPKSVQDFSLNLTEYHDPKHLVNQVNLNHVLDIKSSCNHNHNVSVPIPNIAVHTKLSEHLVFFAILLNAVCLQQLL